jgi:hypothetical protein
MATFKGVDYFSSGPMRIDTTDSVLIRQEGTMIAKSSPELRTLVNALRSKVGECGALVDDQGFSWAGCALIRARFSGVRQVHSKNMVYVDYEAEYRQRQAGVIARCDRTGQGQ